MIDDMKKTSVVAVTASAVPPSVRPERDDLLREMLGATKRAVVPIRRVFLQTPRGTTAADGTRASLLREFARDTTTLDCYLWIAAMSSAAISSDTQRHSAGYPAATWAQVAGLAEHAELDAAKTRWSKAVTRLVALRLIERERSGGKNQATYTLLHEAGTGEPYMRPTLADHGNWFTIPHNYWLDGWDRKFNAPEKLMLLIALDQKDGFDISPERAPAWYGLSRNTAQRGYKGLVEHGVLSRDIDYVADPKSPTGWREVIRYTTEGVWSRAARLKAGKTRKVAKTTGDDV